VSAAPRLGGADPLAARLRRVARESPELAEAARVYGIILPLLRDADLSPRPVPVTAEEVRGRLGRGEPLLPGIGLELDADAARALLARLAAGLETPAGRAGLIRAALEAGDPDAGELLAHAAAGTPSPVAAAAARRGLDAALLWTLCRAALRPALRAWRRQLAPLAEGTPWRRGACFVCGARAALAELRGPARERHLRCAECGAAWRVDRFGCPHCGCEDPAAQRLLRAAGDGRLERVEACAACRGYVKVFEAFLPTPAELLPVEDLATLHLDAAAREHGYVR
jgi:FdhE protein